MGGTPDKQYKLDLEDQVMEFAKDILPELDPQNPEYNKKLTGRFWAITSTICENKFELTLQTPLV